MYIDTAVRYYQLLRQLKSPTVPWLVTANCPRPDNNDTDRCNIKGQFPHVICIRDLEYHGPYFLLSIKAQTLLLVPHKQFSSLGKQTHLMEKHGITMDFV